jgi:L-alanine-DL-glutamate epimerase-like enolase superfamily enzyme
MKICAVDVVLIEEPSTDPPFRWRNGLPGSDPAHIAGWLVLTTDTGVRGYARTPNGVILKDIVDRRIRAELLGRDPMWREFLWHRMWELDRVEQFPIYVLGLVDIALWDIAGKNAGLPVHALIGTFRDRIPAYASTVTFSSIPEYLDIADQCLATGYAAIKLHAWGEARQDAGLAQALRGHVGPDLRLMYDGSAGFDLLDACYVGDALAEAGYYYFEEPMREFSVTAYRRLAERVRVPLLVAETSDGAHMNTGDFIASGCAAAVRTGATLRGGITGAMRTAHLADAYLLRAEILGGGLPNAHLNMAIPNTSFYESLVTSNPIRHDPALDEAATLHAPTGPGMGYEAEWQRSGRHPELADLSLDSTPLRPEGASV